MLAALKKTTKYFRNEFANYALMFYGPVMRLLAANVQCNRDDDGLDTMLPMKVIEALGAFTRCAMNSIHQRSFIDNTFL